MSGRPDAAQRDAEHKLELRKRIREIEQSIMARAPEHDLEPSLDRIAAVMELLGDPQHAFPVIHVTGTNGKTSTARMIERILREMGLSTGRFTSPHLHNIRERIALNGNPIEVEKFIASYEDVLPFIEMVDARSAAEGGPQMTYFEVLVALAYAAFADAPIDVAVVEVGMGGSWDATNVVNAQVAVVTPIALDHERFLGPTVEGIATEKAGIFKTGSLVVSAMQEPEVAEILIERGKEVGTTPAFEGNEFGIARREVAVGGQQLAIRGLGGEYDDLFLPLHGPHQGHNAALALAAVEAFVGGGEHRLDVDLIRAGLAGATSPGRLEVVRRSPTVLVDAAHNPAGALALRAALEDSFNFAKVVGVIAILEDKDASAMLEILEPVLNDVIVSRTTSPRAIDPQRLGQLATEIYGEGRVTVIDNLPDALDRAAEMADEGGFGGGVLATGSITTAAEIRMLLGVTSG
ncbi:MAG: dihydrofolate synthase / folylpolyglutamate synthase [Actinomycetota bacterium]|nr:dihydrofolate synthase / folylpolyglutamate synthase [Actinomycetota bacterium]